TAYKIDWAIQPYFSFDYQKPVGNSFPTGSGNVTEIWLRDYWLNKKGNNIPSDGDQGGSYVQLVTDPVDFQPGEFRLFSVAANPQISASNKLVPTLDVRGTFKINILRSTSKGSEPLDQKDK